MVFIKDKTNDDLNHWVDILHKAELEILEKQVGDTMKMCVYADWIPELEHHSSVDGFVICFVSPCEDAWKYRFWSYFLKTNLSCACKWHNEIFGECAHKWHDEIFRDEQNVNSNNIERMYI